MNTARIGRMRRSSLFACGAAVSLLMLGGCDLDIENPNSPDAERAFVDPAGLEQLISGAFRTWVETRGDYYGALPMTAMADNYTASWNNAAIRFYSSVGSDCASRCGWTNSATAPEAAGGPSIEFQWYGYYTVLSGANDVLAAINNGLCFDDDCAVDATLTSRNKAVAKMLQGMAFAGISMIYDQGFAVDETVDLGANPPTSTPFASRAVMRDSAIAKFNQAYTEAGLNTWSTPSNWMGVNNGLPYTNTQIQQLIRTMQAEVIAMHPRDASEVAGTDWASVATFASQGISSGTAFDWQYYIDITGRECGLDCVKTWGNSIGTMRVDTRLATMLSTNQAHPYPAAAAGNSCPFNAGIYGVDARVGDGSYGPTDDFNGYQTVAATGSAGTDFACSETELFPPARGRYHQSNMQHIRYQHVAYRGENLPGFDATGQDPFYTRWMNELLWAEGLLRSGGSAVTAAARINTSRNGRGGLTALTGVEGTPALLSALAYEQEIEFMGQGPTPFFNRRRLDGLQTGTPFHMPVPAKEMDVLQRAVYTFGGPGGPSKLVAPGGAQRRTVREIFEEMRGMKRVDQIFRR